MIRDNKLDIVLLQETKMLMDKVESLFLFKSGKILGGDAVGASRGMKFLWNDKNTHGELISQNRNMISIIFSNAKDDTSWVQTNVYEPNTKWGRKALWMEIFNHRKKFADEDWIIMGDFNTPLK